MVLALLACTSGPVDSGATAPLNPAQVETDGGALIELTPSADPFTAGVPVTLDLLVSRDGAPVPELDVQVVPYMPDMGHGLASGVEVTESTEAIGVYQAAFTFSMSGYWELELVVDEESALVGYEVE
jgi:hypothetical protein